MENSKFVELKRHYGLTEEDFDKPVSESDLKLISESHHDNLPTPLDESADQIKQEDEGQLSEEPRQSPHTYRGLITTLVKMGRTQDAKRVCQKLKGTTQDEPQLTHPRTQGKPQNKMLRPKKSFTGKGKSTHNSGRDAVKGNVCSTHYNGMY